MAAAIPRHAYPIDAAEVGVGGLDGTGRWSDGMGAGVVVRTFSKLACDGEGTLRFQGCSFFFNNRFRFLFHFDDFCTHTCCSWGKKVPFFLSFFSSFFLQI